MILLFLNVCSGSSYYYKQPQYSSSSYSSYGSASYSSNSVSMPQFDPKLLGDAFFKNVTAALTQLKKTAPPVYQRSDMLDKAVTIIRAKPDAEKDYEEILTSFLMHDIEKIVLAEDPEVPHLFEELFKAVDLKVLIDNLDLTHNQPAQKVVKELVKAAVKKRLYEIQKFRWEELQRAYLDVAAQMKTVPVGERNELTGQHNALRERLFKLDRTRSPEANTGYYQSNSTLDAQIKQLEYEKKWQQAMASFGYKDKSTQYIQSCAKEMQVQAKKQIPNVLRLFYERMDEQAKLLLNNGTRINLESVRKAKQEQAVASKKDTERKVSVYDKHLQIWALQKFAQDMQSGQQERDTFIKQAMDKLNAIRNELAGLNGANTTLGIINNVIASLKAWADQDTTLDALCAACRDSVFDVIEDVFKKYFGVSPYTEFTSIHQVESNTAPINTSEPSFNVWKATYGTSGAIDVYKVEETTATPEKKEEGDDLLSSFKEVASIIKGGGKAEPGKTKDEDKHSELKGQLKDLTDFLGLGDITKPGK